MLCLERVGAGDLDRSLWELGAARLERRDDGLFLECDARPDRVVALMARAGLRARTALSGGLPRDLVPGVARDLEPRSVPSIVDRIVLRPLDAGEATLLLRAGRALVRRPRYPHQARGVLRDEERMFAWTRTLWASPRVFRSRLLRGIRPVVFDRDALERGPTGHAFVRTARIARWAAR